MICVECNDGSVVNGVFRPLNHLRLRWYKKSSTGRTRINADNIKYIISLYGRVLTIRDPLRQDSGLYECEAVFSRPGAQPSSSVVADAVLTVHGLYITLLFVCILVDKCAWDVYRYSSLPVK